MRWLNSITDSMNMKSKQTVGEDREGQRSLVCCSPRGGKELDKTEQLNNITDSLCCTAELTQHYKSIILQ